MSKNSKKKRAEESSFARAKMYEGLDTTDPAITIPPGALAADLEKLDHNNTYGRLPRFYVDRVIVCRSCGKEEVWLASRQKWWYEVAKGNINSQAVLCRKCRGKNE